MTPRRARWLLQTALVLAAVGGALPLSAVAGLSLLAATALLLVVGGSGTAMAVRNRDPRAPKPPRRRVAHPANVGPEPPLQVYEPSTRCTICGRPLTNQQSMIARVGMDCIKRYGPRYKLVTNPAHDLWADRVTKARVDAIAQQVVFDQELAMAQARFEGLRAQHDDELSSPAGRERRDQRRQGSRRLGLAVGSVPVVITLNGLASLIASSLAV